MADDPYRDTDLVGLYDLDNPGGEDHAYYRAQADEIDARSIVDLGCPTEADGVWSSSRKVPCASSHTRVSFRI